MSTTIVHQEKKEKTDAGWNELIVYSESAIETYIQKINALRKANIYLAHVGKFLHTGNRQQTVWRACVPTVIHRLRESQCPPSARINPLPALTWLPCSVIGGWQVIPLSYLTGVLIVYAGFALCLTECIWEPALLEKPYPWQIALIGIVFTLATMFSINVVGALAPLTFDSYAMRKGEYPSGTVIAGILWNSHFTDLRVSITNPTDDDYSDIDIAIQPDKWNYKAAILQENTGCQLISMGGKGINIMPNGIGGATSITGHRVGDEVDATTNVGDVFEHFLTSGGYRLRCGKFPAHSAVQVVFALAAVDQKLIDKVLPPSPTAPKKDGTWRMGYFDLPLPMNKFDLLEPRPSPAVVIVEGHYNRKIKRFSISGCITVADGN